MHGFIRFLAKATALIGGTILLILIAMTTLSIIGRSLNKLMHTEFFAQQLASLSNFVLSLGVGEINGNYELLEAGVAFSIFSFLPICQLYGSHATVDIFTSVLPARVNRFIIAFWEIVLAAVIILIVWQLYGGMERYIRNGQTTLFLQFPVWWAYAISFGAGIVACIVAVYSAAMRLLGSVTDENILPDEKGAH